MKQCFLFLTMLLLINPLRAEIYKWTDSNGNVHFSDKPHAGAQIITIKPTQTYSPSSQVEPSISPAIEEGEDEDENEASPTGYTKIMIAQPQDQETLRNNQRMVSVIADIEPELKKGDTIQLLFDGSPAGPPQTTPAFILNGVNRGSHTLSLQVLNAESATIGTSQSITFFMHQTVRGGGN